MKVDADGLDPATEYWYRFRFQEATSAAGRTRTAPGEDDDVRRLRMAVVSCANMQAGWFTPYRHLAARGDLDLVVHLGDYFYEYAPAVQVQRPDRPAARPAAGNDHAVGLPAAARPVQVRCRPAGAARGRAVGGHMGRPRVGQRRLVRRRAEPHPGRGGRLDRPPRGGAAGLRRVDAGAARGPTGRSTGGCGSARWPVCRCWTCAPTGTSRPPRWSTRPSTTPTARSPARCRRSSWSTGWSTTPSSGS